MTKSPEKAKSFQVDVHKDWCKGCGICVDVCPRDALGVDAAQIPFLSAPDRCTGCLLCEWTCPDFAIRVVDELRLATG